MEHVFLKKNVLPLNDLIITDFNFQTLAKKLIQKPKKEFD